MVWVSGTFGDNEIIYLFDENYLATNAEKCSIIAIKFQ